MKKSLIALLFVLPLTTCAQRQPNTDIEIVESVPVETSLDNADIRDTHEVWLEMIGRAHKTLDIEQFYISHEPGRRMQDVLAAIYAAADRGVKVRVIVDARMYKTYPASVDSLGQHRNIEARRIDFGTAGGGIQHAKYFIVDEEEVFVGSQNFDWRALEHIHEVGLRIRSKDFAEAYGQIFEADWRFSSPSTGTFPGFPESRVRAPIRLKDRNGEVATVVPTYSPMGWIPDTVQWDEHAIVSLIDGARSALTLQFLSYSPMERQGASYTVIDDAIRRAARRGVKVRMIVSDWQKGSSAVTALKSLISVPNVQIAFTVIPEWSGGYISFARVEHCKVIIADSEKFWLGTSNCSKSYFYTSRNLGVVVTGKGLASTLTRIFDKSWNSPYKELLMKDEEYKAREHGERK